MSFDKPVSRINKTLTYADLVKLVHHALRAQHPEWIEADGRSPMFDLYEARFAKVLQLCMEPTDRNPPFRSAS
jgi:hypothetical protein